MSIYFLRIKFNIVSLWISDSNEPHSSVETTKFHLISHKIHVNLQVPHAFDANTINETQVYPELDLGLLKTANLSQLIPLLQNDGSDSLLLFTLCNYLTPVQNDKWVQNANKSEHYFALV